MGDAHLQLCAAMISEQPGARGAAWPGKHLDAPAREADAGAVEAFDDGFLGGPPAGEPFRVARAVGLLGGRVDLVQEAGAGAADGQGYAVHRDGVNTDSLHQLIVGLPRLANLSRPTCPGSLREPGRPPRMAGRGTAPRAASSSPLSPTLSPASGGGGGTRPVMKLPRVFGSLRPWSAP